MTNSQSFESRKSPREKETSHKCDMRPPRNRGKFDMGF
jgi:hypothetical protein